MVAAAAAAAVESTSAAMAAAAPDAALRQMSHDAARGAEDGPAAAVRLSQGVMQSVRIMYCFIYRVSVLLIALYAECPYYAVLHAGRMDSGNEPRW